MHTRSARGLFVLSTFVLWIACSADPSTLGLKGPTDFPRPDAGSDPGPVIPAPCAINLFGDSRASAGGRRNPCFAFDPDGHRLFVWGGTPNARDVLDGLQALELDRGFESWTRLDLPGTPTARSSGSSTFDRTGRRAIFGFGNTSQEIFVDLHALEL